MIPERPEMRVFEGFMETPLSGTIGWSLFRVRDAGKLGPVRFPLISAV
jgi:hypothetical protein